MPPIGGGDGLGSSGDHGGNVAVIQMLAGTSCAQTFTKAAQNGIKEKAKYLMAASVCRASTFTGDKAVGTAYIVWARDHNGLTARNRSGRDQRAQFPRYVSAAGPAWCPALP